jgi:uncharacterized membrane protein YjgN (DUF898 family)
MHDSFSNAGMQPSEAHHLPIEFTGSGSEYFRIWIVNLLLMFVTFGIYYPWAKVRRLRYFHANTLVGGEPLGFHADPKKMLKGYILVGVLFALYSVAGNFSALAGFLAFAIVAAIWPALLKSSMQFRLANTSWRGLRFHFKGSVGGAYRAIVPLFVPSLVILAAVVGIDNPDKPPFWYFATLGVVVVVTLVVFPWLLWNLKQYQHNHYALASLQTTFKATLGSFYKLFFKALGVMMLPIGLAFVIAAVCVFLEITNLSRELMPKAILNPVVFVFYVIAIFIAVATTLVIAKPYVTARLQNLVWTRTGNASLRFVSDLRFKSLLWLTIKNWFFVVLTFGFYWPFAAIAVARMRLEAVTVKTRIDPDTLVSQMRSVEGEAAGDAAGDLFGLDIGF